MTQSPPTQKASGSLSKKVRPKQAVAKVTNLYNARPVWLDHAHKALDEAVAEAYGWGDDWRDGKLTEDEILARLFKLNQERAAAEAKAVAKLKAKPKAKPKGKKNGK